MRKPFNNDYRLTQGFGGNPDLYKKFGLKGHDGLDYALPTGTEVLAPHSGKVIEAKNDPKGYGLYIKIENDIEGSVLAHLKEFNVKAGESVLEGQVIGLSDNTGNSTGAHLHWGYYKVPRDRTNGYAGFIDQLPLLSQPGTSKELEQCNTDRDLNWNVFVKVMNALGITVDPDNKEASADTAVKSINAYKGNSARAEQLEKQLNSIEATHKQELQEISDQNSRLLKQKDLAITELNTTISGITLTKEQLDRTIIALEKQLKDIQEENRRLKSDNPYPTLWERIKAVFRK